MNEEQREERRIEATSELGEAGLAPEEQAGPSRGAAAPDRRDVMGWLRRLPTGVWAAASMVVLLVIVLVAAVVLTMSLRSNQAQVRTLQTRVDALSQELEALRQAQAELEQSVESRMSKQFEALRKDSEAADEALSDEFRAGLDQSSRQLEQVASRIRLEMLLLRASRQALQARIHLAEREAGLAKRNLRDVEAALTAAIQATDDEDLQARLGRLHDSIRELRESIEAQTFPVTTVEVLIDQIDGLLRELSAGQ